MLDVARHFFAVDDVLRYIDLISLYKVNVLHLHLTDDQGWRLDGARLAAAHRGRRRRATSTEGRAASTPPPTTRAIVGYAAEALHRGRPGDRRPGHTSAALVAYPELSCDGVAPPPFHHGGISEVSLCTSAD